MISRERFSELAAAEHKENMKALKGWLAVMTAASFAGWAIGYVGKYWF